MTKDNPLLLVICILGFDYLVLPRTHAHTHNTTQHTRTQILELHRDIDMVTCVCVHAKQTGRRTNPADDLVNTLH